MDHATAQQGLVTVTELNNGDIVPTTKYAYDEVASQLDHARLTRDEPIAPYTTFRIGGPADLFYSATSAADLAHAISVARRAGIPFFVLGLGANILVGDLGFRGLVIHNCANQIEFSDNGVLRAESGVVMGDLIPQAVERGWSGLEHYVGIPSTVGGAVWQNLHFLSPAPQRERTMFIAEIVSSCDVLNAVGDRLTVGTDYLKFGYDDSIFHHQADYALAVTFQLTAGDPAEMHRVIQENLSWRGARHPWLQFHPSAGSIFRKIEGVGAGRLVDKLGLKGHRIGGAQISHIHANIMVNLGGATAHDVRELIALVQRRVKDELGHELTPEIAFIGEFQ
ncbi:MAG: UDP-N-acetylmuramate dehydrogenase [Gemmatimonadaceae bacterium]